MNFKTLKLLFCFGLVLLTGCRQEMYDQPRIEPYSESDFFEDGLAMRPLPQGVVAFGETENGLFRAGVEDEYLATRLPVPVDRPLLERGRERYDIYCGVCHGYTGNGDGMIVKRGFPSPPSFHSERLRNAPVGYFVNVIANGYGVMYSYAARVEPKDRWAIASYIRVLQLSRNVSFDGLSPEEKIQLEGRE